MQIFKPKVPAISRTILCKTCKRKIDNRYRHLKFKEIYAVPPKLRESCQLCVYKEENKEYFPFLAAIEFLGKSVAQRKRHKKRVQKLGAAVSRAEKKNNPRKLKFLKVAKESADVFIRMDKKSALAAIEDFAFKQAYKLAASAESRAGKRMPNWAKTKENREKIFGIYFEATKKNYLKFVSTKADKDLWLQVDHKIPLHGKEVSGFHTPENLQVLPQVVNYAKSNIFYLE